jgi:ABC-type sugar transport system ATPase subunit
MNPVIEMRSIHKHFAGVKALVDVHFDLHQGEIHALVGENGAGKSTLIKILSGIYKLDEGEIFVDGEKADIGSPADAKLLGIAVIYQDFDLAPNLSVADNLMLGREPTRLPGLIHKPRHSQRAKEHLRIIGIDLDIHEYVGNLSAAERQLIAIAKALSSNARALVMDEPTSALATDEIRRLLDLIVELKQQNTSIIYISHKLDEVFTVSDRVTVLRDGKYIGTRKATETSPDEVVSLMVGRTLKDLYFKTSHVQDETLLLVSGLQRTRVLTDISFRLSRGEVLGIYGLKGAGRTELSRVLFGLDSRNSGEIRLGGQAVRVTSPVDAIHCGIGYIPEDRKNQGLLPNMSVKENMSITVLGKINRKGFIQKRRERELINRYVQRLRIRTASIETMILDLSGGNQQKVVLARWLITNPQVLILDEPTVGIDVGAKSEIYKLITELTSSGVGVILISSEIPEILGMSDRVLVMHEGTIVGEFSANEATEERIIQSIHRKKHTE